MALTQVQPGMLGTPQPYSFKNRIINGAMVLNQRGGKSSTSNGGGGGLGGGGAAGSAGTANTGGGGGGCNPSQAYAGGSGVVVLAVPTSNYSGTYTGTATVTTSGSNTLITWTSGSGSYTA